MKILFGFLLVIVVLTSGCASDMTIRTYKKAKPGDKANEEGMCVVASTTIRHRFWRYFPALAPLDGGIKDGEFEAHSKAVGLNGIIGALKK